MKTPPTNNNKTQHAHDSKGKGAHFCLYAILLVLVLGGWLLSQSSGAFAFDNEVIPESTTPLPVMLSPTPLVSEEAGWEQAALTDLAELLNWPPTVTRDSTGRLIVQRVVTGTEWLKATIRPLGFRAAAEAAFIAEQEDARLAGYTINLDRFHSYPAYWATMTSGAGLIIERRLHWQADSWILGVDIRSLSPRIEDVQSLGQQLLALSIQYGLPPPPGGSEATPTLILPVMPSATATRVSCNIGFSDVPANFWANDYISELACKGVVSGYSDNTFRPQNPTTRGQLVKMVVLSQGWQLLRPSKPTFSDISRGHTFFRYIETAAARGIISGYSDKTFRSDDYVTRAQVAKMLVLAKRWPAPQGAGSELCDVPRTHWASTYVQTAIERGVFTGYSDGCFYPDAYATRAQLAKVLVLSER
jgi:hypothetical protein